MGADQRLAMDAWSNLSDDIHVRRQRHRLRRLFDRLKAYEVRWWRPEDAEEVIYEPGVDRVSKDVRFANVVSSELIESDFLEAKHVLAIDLDVPAYLVASTTPDHSHLYVDVPGGIPHDKYMALLKLLAECGVIEPGYAEVSIRRGHSDLRPPWIKKGEEG